MAVPIPLYFLCVVCVLGVFGVGGFICSLAAACAACLRVLRVHLRVRARVVGQPVSVASVRVRPRLFVFHASVHRWPNAKPQYTS